MSSLLLPNDRAGHCRQMSSSCASQGMYGSNSITVPVLSPERSSPCQPTVLAGSNTTALATLSTVIPTLWFMAICVCAQEARDALRHPSCQTRAIVNGIANQNPAGVVDRATQKIILDLLIMVDPEIGDIDGIYVKPDLP